MNYATLCRSAIAAALVLLTTNGYAQQWRLKAKLNEHPVGTSFVPIDSTDYYYIPQTNRGSNYNNTSVQFDEAYQYRGQQGGGYGIGEETHRTYNSSDQVVSEVYRTLVGGVMTTTRRDTFIYQAGVCMNFKRYEWKTVSQGTKQWVNTVEEKYTYNVKALRTMIDRYEYQGKTPLTNVMRRYYAYNANDDMILDSAMVYKANAWTRETTQHYVYTGSVMTFRDELRYLVGYGYGHYLTNNAAGQVIKDSMVTIGPKTDPLIFTYTYNGQGLLIADSLRYPTYLHSYHTYSYTSFDYLSAYTSYSRSSNNVQEPYSRIRYQYEIYWPVSVSQAVYDNDDVVLYPNPATTELRISSNEQWQQGRIYNSMGQMVQVVNANSKQVDISRLPVGNYYLQLTTNDKTMSKRFTVVR